MDINIKDNTKKTNNINLPFFQSLQPASWRNIPFGITSTSMSLGRKLAIHEYPYTDGVWVEDLGAKGKNFHIMGFIVEGGGAYGGNGSLKDQIEAFEKIVLQWEDGILCHPTLGVRAKMALQHLEIEQDLQGRTASLRFTFIENAVNPTSMVLAKQACVSLLKYKYVAKRDCSIRSNGCYGVWTRQQDRYSKCMGVQ